MTTNKQLRALLDGFANELQNYRSGIENDDQRWGFDQAIAAFLRTTTSPGFGWVWEIDHPFSGTVAAVTGVSRSRPVEIARFSEKSGYCNPPSYKLIKNQKGD